MARIHIESLNAEYREKLCSRKLTRETIDSLASTVSRKYLQKKQAFKSVTFFMITATILMVLMMLLSPNAQGGSMKAIAFSLAAVLVMEILILAAVYYGVVTRVPRQFAQCLRKGYPELEMEYGYEQIIDGSFADQKKPQQFDFFLKIEDVFRLKNSKDVVVVGFAHGLIARGNSFFILNKDASSPKRAGAVVTAIEKGNEEPAMQAADCKVALKIQKGAELALAPGMHLYR